MAGHREWAFDQFKILSVEVTNTFLRTSSSIAARSSSKSSAIGIPPKLGMLVTPAESWAN